MNKKIRIGLFIITIISFLGTLIILPKLPDMVPMHWNIRWEVDRYDSKNMLLLTATIPIILNISLGFIPKIDPKKDNYKLHSKAYDFTIFCTILLLVVMNWLGIGIALKINVNIQMIIPILLSILFFVMGNYMPTIRSNYTFGIKNPWTLADDLVWKKTHRVGGYVNILAGFLFLIMAFIHQEIFYILCLLFIIVSILGINVYSYLLYKRIKN